MKISVGQIKQHQQYELSEQVSFEKDMYANEYVRDISNVICKVTYSMEGDFLTIHYEIKGDAILACSYTLEDVNYKIKAKDDFTYTDNPENEDESVILFTKNEIELDEDILDIILASFPMSVHKKGAKLPDDGKGYRVLSEDEYLKEKENKKTSPFDDLLDLDLDD